MAFSLELKRTLNQQNDFNRVKERVFTPQANQSTKYQDKMKVKSRVVPSSSDLCSESRQDADGRILIQAKTSKSFQKKHSLKSSSTADDELVKHMSNLPNYLLRTEGEENIQEKALNVGVLDWSRLEKWKHKQKHIPDRGNNDASCSRHPSLKQTTGSSHFPNGTHRETPAERNSSICPPKCFNSSAPTASHFQEAEKVFKVNTREQMRKPCAYSDMVHDREKRKYLDQKTAPAMTSFSSNMRNNTVSLCPKRSAHVCDDEPNRYTEKLKGTDMKRKDADQKVLLQVEDVSLKSTNGTSLSSKAVKLQDSDIVTHQHSRGEHCIVLLLPKQKIQNGIPDAFHSLPLRTSFDENLLETNSSSNSDVFSPGEILSSEFCSEIPHSCPLPSLDVDSAFQDVMHFSPVKDRTSIMKPSFVSSQLFPLSNKLPSLTPESKHSGTNKLDTALTNSEAVNTSKTFDHEIADFGDRRSRNPSPNRRFSFSLGRMGRSFSFKESSTIPRLSSAYVTPKSGPVKSEAPAPFEGLDREKINGNNRARSSPLRRLIEPILKYKAANSPHCEEASLNSFSNWANVISQKEKHVASTVRALLQVTVKNGLPLYMLTVDNNRNIFAATMRSMASMEKDESGQNYTFYSVNEIKRKNGGWMRGGSKEKLSSYVYNVVGQMKVSSSHFLDLGREKKSSGMYTLRESVLFGVEVRTGNHESPKFKKNRELAAAVFKMPIQKVDHDRKQDDKMNHCDKCWEESICVCTNSREIGETDNVIVILPGGLHGSPSDGEPSPLINRWKSGGSCDCGGWDVGCKLRVFSNPQKCDMDCFELFIQGGALQDKPIFSMAPLKEGMYSIEFNSSISLLQAFFICVSVTSCEKTSDLSGMCNITSESKALKEPKFNSSDELRGKAPPRYAPARYAPNPPLSPVGRV